MKKFQKLTSESMLDSGSFYNLITEKLVNKLKLNIQKKQKIKSQSTLYDQFV